jgi:hypothetical protein
MLAAKELETIKKVLEEEFKTLPQYQTFRRMIEHHAYTHSEEDVSQIHQFSQSNLKTCSKLENSLLAEDLIETMIHILR